MLHRSLRPWPRALAARCADVGLRAVPALWIAGALAGCANPYCGAAGEACCGSECAPGLSCVLEVCRSGGVGPCGGSGQACCANDACSTGLSCYGGTCSPTRPSCDPFVAGSCGAGQHCAWSGAETSACWSNGPGAADSPCTTPNDCADGLGCDDSLADYVRCRVPCRVDSECMGISRNGMCLDYAYPSTAKYCW